MHQPASRALAIWEKFQGQAQPKIRALCADIREALSRDKSLARFRGKSRLPRQFYEILEERANVWVAQVHEICRESLKGPEPPEFLPAVLNFEIEPFIDGEFMDLLFRAAGLESIECQLVKRGEREVRAYMPEKYASIMQVASACYRIRARVRSRWMAKLRGQTTFTAVNEINTSENDDDRNSVTCADSKEMARLKLGEWAESRLEEARKFAALLRGGKSPKELQNAFPELFFEVIEKLSETRRKRLFDEASRMLMRVPDLMDYLADVKGLKGVTLQEYRLLYRKEARIGRTAD